MDKKVKGTGSVKMIKRTVLSEKFDIELAANDSSY